MRMLPKIEEYQVEKTSDFPSAPAQMRTVKSLAEIRALRDEGNLIAFFPQSSGNYLVMCESTKGME